MKIKYSSDLLENIVKKSVSIMEVLRYLNLKPSGGNHSHIKNRIKTLGIDTSHFLGSRANSGKNHKGPRVAINDLLSYNRKGRRENAKRLRNALISCGVEYKCFDCGISNTYNNKPITLEIHHIDEDFLNNNKENLKFLCPNCHSQQKLIIDESNKEL
jgi:5-methylcytosine-specific restriction endonuclease McrA